MHIAISGSGRCGTSMVAGLLGHCGLYMGRKTVDGLTYGDERNAKGFWEHGEFLGITRRVLDHLDRTYNLPNELLPRGWEDEPALDMYYDEARRMIQQLFSGHDAWGWKFTHSPVVLLFWRKVVPDLRFILCVRNPRDVVASLLKFGGFSRPQAQLLWLYNNTRFLLDTIPSQRAVTFYEDYFPDYRNGLLPLLDFAGLPQPEEGSQMEKQLAAFHSADLNHHASTMDEVMSDPTIPNLAKELYAQLLSAGWGGSNIPLLEHADLFFQLLTDAKVSADLLTVTLIRNGREIPEGRPLAAECFRFANELVNERDHVNQVLNSRVHRVAAIVGQTLADVKGRHARVPNAVSRPGKNRSGIADNSKLGREDFSANNADQNEPTLESSSPSAL